MIGSEQGLDPIETELFDRGTRLGARVRVEGSDLGLELRPFGFGQARLGRAIERRDCILMQRGESAGPGGIDSIEQRQGASRFDPGQRETRNLAGGDGKILGREGEVFGF